MLGRCSSSHRSSSCCCSCQPLDNVYCMSYRVQGTYTHKQLYTTGTQNCAVLGREAIARPAPSLYSICTLQTPEPQQHKHDPTNQQMLTQNWEREMSVVTPQKGVFGTHVSNVFRRVETTPEAGRDNTQSRDLQQHKVQPPTVCRGCHQAHPVHTCTADSSTVYIVVSAV